MLKLLPLLLFALAAFNGCAEQSTSSSSDRVSNIPWNRPERWEGQGAMGMGGLMPGAMQ